MAGADAAVETREEPNAESSRWKRGAEDRGKTMERRPPGSLNPEKVRTAREMRRRGFTYSAIAKEFGVTGVTARAAVLGETWRHVPGPVKSRRRVARGKLTPEMVLMAREMRRVGCTYRQIAKRCGVSRLAVWHAVVGVTWRHLPDPVMARRHPRISPEEVAKIKDLRERGFSQPMIAQATGRSRRAIQLITGSRRGA
jgi:predicted transcriptional regulator